MAIGGASAGGGITAALALLAHDRAEIRPVFPLLVYPMPECLALERSHRVRRVAAPEVAILAGDGHPAVSAMCTTMPRRLSHGSQGTMCGGPSASRSAGCAVVFGNHLVGAVQ
nr:alpha/beta hydrolase fold domain-containing protein [Lentzea flava]